MAAQNFPEEARRYLAVLIHWLWLLFLATVLTGLAAYLASKKMTPIYRASTTVLINEAPANTTTDYSSILTSERLAQTYAELITKEPVLQRVIEQLGLQMDVTQLRYEIQVQLVRDTQLIVVQVEDTNPQRAADIANQVVAEFTKQNQDLQASRYAASKINLEAQLTQLDVKIRLTNQSLADLENTPDARVERDHLETNLAQYNQTYTYLLQSFEEVRLAEAQSTSSVYQAEPAGRPASPVRPRVLVNTVLACMAGLVLAGGGVFLREALDDTLRNPGEITRQFGLPILGVIAHYQLKGEKPLTSEEPRSPVSEAFRSLRTNIQYASVDRPIRTLLVTSPSPSEGKSSIAANLAVVMAQYDRKVVFVDADLRRPRSHEMFNLPNRQGLSELFVQPQVFLNGTLQSTWIKDLSLLASGLLPPNPSELLGSDKMEQVLQRVGEAADFIVIDSPPVLAVTDAVVLAPRVDGVLLVVKPGVTKQVAFKQAIEQLRQVGAKLVGVVLNDVEFKRSRYAYYHYQGYYYAFYDHSGNSPNGSQSRN